MNTFFEQSRSHWVRYERYEIKIGKDGKKYITPAKDARPDVYNPLKEAPYCTGCPECGYADDERKEKLRAGGGKGDLGVYHPLWNAGSDDSPADYAGYYGL